MNMSRLHFTILLPKAANHLEMCHMCLLFGYMPNSIDFIVADVHVRLQLYSSKLCIYTQAIAEKMSRGFLPGRFKVFVFFNDFNDKGPALAPTK